MISPEFSLVTEEFELVEGEMGLNVVVGRTKGDLSFRVFLNQSLIGSNSLKLILYCTFRYRL